MNLPESIFEINKFYLVKCGNADVLCFPFIKKENLYSFMSTIAKKFQYCIFHFITGCCNNVHELKRTYT